MRARAIVIGVFLLLTTGCATGGPVAAIGQRVSIPERRVVDRPDGESRSDVVGEYVRQKGDTVWVRPDGAAEPGRYVLRRRTTLRTRPPGSVDADWLVGDSLRVRRGDLPPMSWEVSGASGDSLLLGGPARLPLGVLAGQEEHIGELQRQVLRSRPGGPLVLGSIALVGGVLLFRAIREDPIEVDNEEAVPFYGGIFAAMAITMIPIAGAVAIMSSGSPRLGWDALEPGALPPVVLESGVEVGLSIPWPFAPDPGGR